MTHVRLSDLGPRARAQVEAAAANVAGASPRRGKSRAGIGEATPCRAGIGEATPCRGTCHECGETFPRFTLWLAHIRDEHDNHGRWEIDLTATTEDP